MDSLSKEQFYYALRLTPHPNTKEKVMYCREKIPEFIEAVSGVSYLFGQEYENNYHFHIVFSTNDHFGTSPSKDPRAEQIRDTLYEIFEVPEDKEGNSTYSFEEVRAIDEAFPYAVKDGDYQYSEDWESVATEAYEKSYPKPKSLKTSLADLTDKYIKGEINDRLLWIGLGQSRADLGIPLSIRWIDEMLLSIQCKKDPNKLQNLWEDIEIRKQLKSM